MDGVVERSWHLKSERCPSFVAEQQLRPVDWGSICVLTSHTPAFPNSIPSCFVLIPLVLEVSLSLKGDWQREAEGTRARSLR